MRQETVINRPKVQEWRASRGAGWQRWLQGKGPALKGKLTRTSNRYSTINLIDRHRSNLSLALRTIRERRAHCFHSSESICTPCTSRGCFRSIF
jgi:hypothetical protein